MKKSNKLIPAVFFAMLVMIITLNIVLFVIYLDGNTSSFQAENASSSPAQSLPHFLFVSLHTLSGAT